VSRILLDTDVVISALGFGGRPRVLLDEAIDGAHDLVTSPALLAELARTLSGVLGMDDAHIRETIDLLIRVSDIVEPTQRLAVCRDPADDRVLECAVTGQVEYVATGDEDLLCIREFEGVRIVRVAEFERI
jgi:putative PIN family toxin of toxin-antitoxin system